MYDENVMLTLLHDQNLTRARPLMVLHCNSVTDFVYCTGASGTTVQFPFGPPEWQFWVQDCADVPPTQKCLPGTAYTKQDTHDR
jgi:hypothetical protein